MLPYLLHVVVLGRGTAGGSLDEGFKSFLLPFFPLNGANFSYRLISMIFFYFCE